MMNKHLFLFLILFPLGLFAQQHTNFSRSEIGVMVGTSSYLGDLSPMNPFQQVHLSAGVLYRYRLHSRTSIRANFTYGKVSGDDATSNRAEHLQRNLNFQSNIFELGVGVEFNYLPFQLGKRGDYWGTAYLFGGVAGFYMNPKTAYQGDLIELQPLGTEGQGTSLTNKKPYSRFQLSIPLGLGVKFRLGERMCVGLEAGIRKTFTDYLDDVASNAYADQAVISAENGPIAGALSNKTGNRFANRGNASTKDWYIITGVHLTINLGKEVYCSYQR